MTKEIKVRFDALQTQINLLEGKVANLKPLTTESHIFHCANCGNQYVLNKNQYERRKDKNKVFYCASGHGNAFN